MTTSKVAVVAAAGPGIGAAVARRFAREGYAVALLARRQEGVDAMASELVAAGGAARGFAVDLTDLAAIAPTLAAVETRMGAPEVLVWNGGRWVESPAMTLDPAALESELRLGPVGALVATQAVFPAMKAAGRGTVLWTGGGLALAPEHGGAVPALTAAKAALRALALACAPELAAGGVRLATITIAGLVKAGGPFDPDRIADVFWDAHVDSFPERRPERVFSPAPTSSA